MAGRDHMELKDMRYIIAIAKNQNLTKAAEELFISQPALSLFLKSVEQKYNVRLFERQGKRFVTTSIGESFVRDAKNVLHLSNNLESKLISAQDDHNAKFTIGMVNARAIMFYAKILPAFGVKHQNIRVEVVEKYSDELLGILERGEVDMAIINNLPDENSNLNYVVLRHNESVLCISEKNPVCEKAIPLANRKYPWLDISLIKNDRFITAGASSNKRLMPSMNEILSKHGQYDNIPLKVSNILTAVPLAAGGYGHLYAFADPVIFVPDAKIKLFSIDDTPLQQEVVLAYRKDYYMPSCVADFIKILQENYPAN